MTTIFPPQNGVFYNKEELAANTDPVYPPRQEPLTPAQLDELRAKAPAADPNSHNAQAAAWRAERAKRITVTVTEEQAERLKSEQQRSGAPVSLQVRRALDLADKKKAAE